MKIRKFIKNKIDAVSTVVSAILAITIVILTAFSTIYWGIPYINDLQSKESLENAKMQFNIILENIKDMITGEADGKNILSVAIEEGSISINKNNFDRTILLYSLKNNSEYNFTVNSLEDNNNEFNLSMSNYSNIYATARFYTYPFDNENYYEENLTVSAEGKVKASNGFNGRVNISLYNGSINEQNLFGKIWLFDSDSLLYKMNSNIGLYKLYLEKGGIIYIEDGSSKVEKLFNVFLEDNYFGLHVLQIVSSKSFSMSGDGGFNIRLSIESFGSSMQEIGNVYNLSLQLHGNNAQTWLNYIDNKYKNRFVLSGNTLFLLESRNGVDIAFLNSIVDIDKV